MATTTNFGWETPDDTDLVKDGAAAIRTALGGVDTSFVDLKGGTTGQVLAKASATDLDFTWATDASGIPATIFDAKGDIIAATAADTAARLAVGTNGQVLKADSTAATGLAWGSAAATKDYSLLGTGTLSGAATITVSGISNMDEIFILVNNASSTVAPVEYQVRFNADSGANYLTSTWSYYAGSSYAATQLSAISDTNNGIIFAQLSGNAGSVAAGYLKISGAATAGKKIIHHAGGATASSSNGQIAVTGGGVWNSTSAITSVSLVSGGGNFDAGTFTVYGAA